MDVSDSTSSIWQEIELSESYLVCSMYEEAASLSSSLMKRLLEHHHREGTTSSALTDSGLLDMLEASGMVLVQSLNQLGRASEIVKELQLLFISAAAMPVQVLLTGACFQISEGSCLDVQLFLEEFLGSWSCVDGQCYILGGANIDVPVQEGCDGRYRFSVDEYLEIAEVYAVTLLGTTLKDLDNAISWVEKAALPDDRKQGLLRRLHSLYSSKATNPSQDSSVSPEVVDGAPCSSARQLDISQGSPEGLNTNYLANGSRHTKQSILKLSGGVDSCFWWFRSINLKLGGLQLAITNGKIVLGCLVLLVYYVLRRKQHGLNGLVKRQIMMMKKGLSDLWQLAFSYQVNPLAAVQPLPAATAGRR